MQVLAGCRTAGISINSVPPTLTSEGGGETYTGQVRIILARLYTSDFLAKGSASKAESALVVVVKVVLRSCVTQTQRVVPSGIKKYVLRTKMDNAE